MSLTKSTGAHVSFYFIFAWCPSPLKSSVCPDDVDLKIQEALWIVAESDIISVMEGCRTSTRMDGEKENY